jgi:predicted DNA-binding protein
VSRPKVKESGAVSFRLRKDLLDRLNEYSEETMIPKTRVVEKALESYLDSTEKR